MPGKGSHRKPIRPFLAGREGARRTAESLALTKAGVLAFFTSADAEIGSYDDEPTVILRPANCLLHLTHNTGRSFPIAGTEPMLSCPYQLRWRLRLSASQIHLPIRNSWNEELPRFRTE